MPCGNQTLRYLLPFLCCYLLCASTLYAQVGGGYTAGGLQGEYFANGELSGAPAFTRREVRLDFDWGTLLPIGGSNDPRYKSFPRDNFSARYTGQIIAAFTESYTFKTIADDGVRLYIRPEGSGAWTPLIDAWSAPATSSATVDLAAGQRYDLMVEYRQLTGAALLRLFWSSKGTPEEVIDPVVEQGYNVGNWGNAFVDLVKCSRNSWLEGGNGAVTLDADGWPQNDASYLYQESANTGLDLDPLMTGTITFSFNGTGEIDLYNGNQERSTLNVSYDAATNTTSGSFMTKPSHWNASYFIVRNTDRDGHTPPRKNGITNLKLIRPKVPGGTEPYPPGTVFNGHFRTAYSKFTSLRVNLNNANVERFWSDRTLPSYFNQANGKGTFNAYPPNAGQNNTPMATDNGASWEHKIMMANETGADLYINLPMMATGWTPADTDSYVHKLARLLRYGSDGVEPYSGPTADPVYPPLNPNLRVYIELSNEVWNTMNFGFRQSFDLLTMTTLDADAALGDPAALADPLARPVDFPIINYDNLSTQKDSGNWYIPINTWNKRKQILRVIQISSIFRSVWGDGKMLSRIRPLYEWQYDNANNTASYALTFANDWFNNGNGASNVAQPHPVNYFIWGGGGASYYGAVNGYGVTDLLPNSGFESPVVAAGYSQNPAGAGWMFQGTAGIARDAGSGDDIPPPFDGGQMGYIDGSGSMSIQVKIPATQTSNRYAFVFKALQRVKVGAPPDGNGNPTADSQKLRVFIDGVESNWSSFNQSRGYTPLPYDPYKPWNSFVVFWTPTTPYYSTIAFTAAPGSTVTLRIEGSAHPDQIAFLEDVHLSSVDQLFADGFPGGGEAAGQPAGSGYQNGLNIQSAWAHAYGLQYVTYEGGWSLGGDTGGTPLQNLAKYNDPGTIDVNSRAIDMFHKAGGSLNTFGTYTLWPNWGEVYAEEGLLDVTRYPLMISQADRMNKLPSEPTNGVYLPNFLGVANVSLKENVNVSGDLTGRGWLSWNIISAVTTTYTITVATTAGGTAQLSLDGVNQDGPFITGQPFAKTVTLTKGLHNIRLNGMSSGFTLQQVTVAVVGAPELPTITSITDTSGALIVTWAPVAGATGYTVRWGTEPNRYDFSATVGDVTSYVITGLAHDTTYYVVVFADNAAGSSLPSVEAGRTALVDGLTGHLAGWNFDGDTGTVSSHPPTAKSSRLLVTDLVYGPGLKRSDYGITYSADSFAYQRADGLMDADSLTLESAFASGQYSEFTLTPTPGATLSISSVMFVPYWQNYAKSGGVAWSVGNGPYTLATMSGTPRAYVGNPLTADLAAIAQLQSLTGTVHLRLLHTGISRYEFAGIGRHPGDDIVVMGSVLSGTVDGRCGAADGQDFSVPPATATDLCAVGSASAVSGSGPWRWSCGGQYGGATAACSTHSNRYDVTNATLKYSVSDSGYLSGAGWLSWDISAATSDIYGITVMTTVGGSAQLSLDGTPLDLPFATGQPFTTMVTLSKGVHTLRLAGMEGDFTLQQVTVAILAAPDAPTIMSCADISGSLVVTWAPTARAAGYTVRWGVQPDPSDFSATVGDVSRYVITGINHDTTYYVTVTADNAAGSSSPSAEVARTALTDGLVGRLVTWNFDYDPGTVPSHPPTANSSRLVVTDLVYGPGFRKSDYELSYTVDSFAYQRALNLTDADSLTLESALASGQYSEFTVTPTPGTALSISSVMFAPYCVATPPMGGVAWSLDGGPFTIATMAGSPGLYSGSPLTADLAEVPQLHSVTGTLRLRLLHAGILGSFAGIGRHPGDDIVVMGSLISGPVDGRCGAGDGQRFALSPSKATDLCAGGSASAVSGNGPWEWSCIGRNSGSGASCTAQSYGTISVATSPVGLGFTLDGTAYSTSQSFNWAPGRSYAIATSSPQDGPAGTRHLFASWSDNGALSHTITAPAEGSASYTANFTTQYQVTTSAGSGGSVTPLSGGWYDAGSVVTVSVTPDSGFHIASVLVDGVSQTVIDPKSFSFTFPALSADHTVSATFAIMPPVVRSNVALATNGGVATASSVYNATTYPVASVNNGDRKGINWGAGGGWNDATSNLYPDWVQITFNGQQSIDEVDLFTLQDLYTGPVEPTPALTFTKYGITYFDVQAWNGTAWVTVAGITGNSQVWRKIPLAPAVITDRIRVQVNASLGSYSRIVEIEAYGSTGVIAPAPTRTNVALATNGGVATASSVYNATTYPIASVNNGDRKGVKWGGGGGWNDATGNLYPDWVQITFNGQKTIDEVDLFTLQDAFASPLEPTATQTFTLYGVTAFDIQAWNGSAWVTVTGGAVTGNNLVWRKIGFPAVTTDRIRVQVNGALGGYSRITEIEAYSSAGSAVAAPAITTVNPTSIVQRVAATVTIDGTDLSGATVSYSNGSVGTAITATATRIVIPITGTVAGSGTVTVITAGGSATATLTVTAAGSTRTNVALAANGGVASASSVYGTTAYPIASVNNGERKGVNWGAGGGWNDATNNLYPDWVQITFNGQKTIDEVDLFTLQDLYTAPVDPTSTMSFTKYGVTAFDVQAWNGSAWVTVAGISGNSLVWKKITLTPAVTTDRIRVQVNGSLGNYSRITEIEAYGL